MTFHRPFDLSRPARRALPALLAAALLSACGGGGDAASDTGSGATLTYTRGTIDGLGSIVVNGVRFDDTQARVLDDAGAQQAADALKLGMVVEVAAPAAQADAAGVPRATAQEVRFASELQGPVATFDAQGMVVLGQTVRFNARTVFEDGRAATLQAGRLVEVHGLRDAQGVVHASRIETEDDAHEPYKLLTVVGQLDAAARTFTSGAATISYAALAPAPALQNGQRVRVLLAQQPEASGHWRATALKALAPLGDGSGGASGVEADIEGYVTRVDGPRRFVVAGVTVNADNARKFPASLAVGNFVEVEGRLTDGTLIAREVELEDGPDDDDGFEIEGRITAVDHAASTLQVRGLTVHFAGARIAGGSAAGLVVGAKVEVEGQLSADGASVQARVIEFD